MHSQLEIEIKLAVASQEELDRVRHVAGGRVRHIVRQVNHFFDDAPRTLTRLGYGLRLRSETSDRLATNWLTLKGPNTSMNAALMTRAEWEWPLTKAEFNAYLAQQQDPLLAVITRHPSELTPLADIGPLEYIGYFENERTRVETVMIVEGNGLEVVLELDKTTLPSGRVEYEVELELAASTVPDEAESALRSLLAIAGVHGTPAVSKFQRFLADAI